MMKTDTLREINILREKAEELLKNNAKPDSVSNNEEELVALLRNPEISRAAISTPNDELVMLKAELRQSRKQFFELYENSAHAYLTISSSGEILELNNAAANLVRKDAAELLSLDFRHFISEDSVWIFDHFLENLFVTRQKLTCEIVLEGPQPVYAELTGFISSDGNCILSAIDVSGLREVDELKKSEGIMRFLFDNTDDALFVIHGDQISFVNKAFTNITGYHLNDSSLIRLTVSDLSGDWIFPEVKKGEKHLETRFETRIKTRTGELVRVEILVSLVSFGIYTCRMTRVESREVILSAHYHRFKQKFLSRMNHEIRTPLTGIIGMAELLKLTRLKNDQLDLLNTLQESTENLFEVVNRILDYDNIEAGKIKLRPVAFTSASLADNATRLFHGMYTGSEITFETWTDQFLPEIIVADEHRVNQVISNLVSNAVKFTQQGKISVKTRLEKWITPETFVVGVEVADTGVGIPQDVLSLIFQPFEQFDNKPDSENSEGVGLGLTICKDLARMMGGHITAESVEGKASILYFTFTASKVPEKEVSKPAKTISLQPKNRFKILYAEDKKVNRKVVGLLLESLGHEVVLVTNGKEAVEMMETTDFDLVLMDIQMPVMDGIAAMQEIKRKYKNPPPVIALTANAAPGEREKYIGMGMDDYISKPVTGKDLKSLIEKFSETRKIK
jgi:signal transduction histidine kinase/ActR/RegA family two-component response regulator